MPLRRQAGDAEDRGDTTGNIPPWGTFPTAMGRTRIDRLAVSATLHCFAGCALGEIAGLVLGAALGLGTLATIALAVALAFLLGYALTLRGLVRGGLTVRAALGVALLADTASIAVMEAVDNGAMVAIPGAMGASLGDARFWPAMALSLALALLAALPVNAWLITRGRGHAVAHAHHAHG